MNPLNGYFNHIGSKNNSGLVQFIINHIPPHNTFIEAFAGSAVIARNIYDGQVILLIDKDEEITTKLSFYSGDNTEVFNSCFIDFLTQNLLFWDPKEIFIYADPPYPFNSRKQQKELYKCEMSDDDHIKLLSNLNKVKCNVMISTRENEIYNEMLKDWTKLEFETVDRGGKAIEQIFVNYPVPLQKLHTYKFIGNDFTERQFLKRKKRNLIRKLQKIKTERPQLYFAMLQQLKEIITQEGI